MLPVTLHRVIASTASRAFSTSRTTCKPLELAHEVFQPSPSDRPMFQKTSALVICHGLYGSKQNWRSLAKAMVKEFALPIYTMDMRNHGSSPHADTMTYLDMAGDIEKFFSDKQLSNVTLIGHSMGGKVAQTMALNPRLPSHALSHLISVDMTPAAGPISPEFMRYARCMVEINKEQVQSRSEADKIMKEIEPNLSVRQFLLTNLERQGETMQFRIPVEKIMHALEEIGEFPYAPPVDEHSAPERLWNGPTLFVKGERSKYINRHNIPLCKAYFPSMQLKVLPTGHWCQSEAPGAFIDTVKAFLLQ